MLNGWERVVGSVYAVKTVAIGSDLGFDEREHRMKQVEKEVELLSACHNHPNILQLLEHYEMDESSVLVFELIEGGELFHHIEQRSVTISSHLTLFAPHRPSAMWDIPHLAAGHVQKSRAAGHVQQVTCSRSRAAGHVQQVTCSRYYHHHHHHHFVAVVKVLASKPLLTILESNRDIGGT
jgi:serine/threonine protein kinase